MATATSINTLDSTYTSLINYQIQLESKPLTALTTQQSTLKLQRAVYNDLKTKLEALRTATKALNSTNAFYALKSGRTISVSNIATGTTVVSASTSGSAIASSYDISNISLALTDRVRSDEQEYSDQALGQEGTIYLGGAAARTAVKKFQGVNNFGTGAVAVGNEKLTDGTYFVETRKESDVWQFRLVNSSGAAQTIDGSGTDGWQAIAAGNKDTGRGLTIDFGSDPSKYVAADKSNSLAASVVFSSVDDAKSIKSSLNTVSNFGQEATIAEGQLELGKGTYYVETRNDPSSGWQFRLVDSEGNAAKIRSGSSTSTYTKDWQSIPTTGSTYSTGRGLTIDFGTDASKFAAKSKLSGALSVDYQAKGAAIEVKTGMSLNDIATAISSANYASGNEVIATVVNKQLVLSSKMTGINHKIQASGDVLKNLGVLTDSGFKNVMQSAKDATFQVNGLAITRSQNTALSDVISGVTLNLASDAEGKSATITVASDNTTSKNAISSFITNFNTVQTYLSSKLSLTKQTDGTYLRGSLSGDQSIMSLRNSLFSMFGSYDAAGGVYKSFKDIGIEVNSSLTAVITDSSKLEKALKENFSEVQKLVDRVSANIENKLAKYTGTASYVDQKIKATDTLSTNVASQIKTWNARIEQRKATLTNLYTDVQAQLTSLSYTSNTNTAWINSLYSSINSQG